MPHHHRPLRHATRWLSAVLGATVTLVACGDATGPLPRDGVPAVLDVSVGGYGAGLSTISMAGDTVVLRRVPWSWEGARPPVDSVRRVPSAEDWRAFWEAAAAAGVSRWRASYVAPDVVDGTGWSVEIVSGGRRFASSGTNAYPDHAGREHRDAQTPAFQAFLAAVDRLVGEPFIQF